jgi:hypothetical protein
VPGARQALAACDKNLGPESLVFLAPVESRNAGANESVAAVAGLQAATAGGRGGAEASSVAPAGVGGANAFLGAALLTFCETPASAALRKDALSGFLFDASYPGTPDPHIGARTALVGAITLVGLSDNCGLSDSTLTPDGLHVLLLYHCYVPAPPGASGIETSRSEIRAAPVRLLRVPGAEVNTKP